MLIVRSPLRISLGGGGTDLPSYYREHEGYLVSAAIDKYVYIIMHENFENELILKYSKTERVKKLSQILHPIFREALTYLNINPINFELASMADIPGGTGMGSSGSFTCALLKALHTYTNTPSTQESIAQEACYIELDVLKEPIGKQDQYISSYGGIKEFTFNKDNTVSHRNLNISNETLYDLEDNLLLFFTGFSRSASAVLKDQDTKSRQHDTTMLDNLHHVKENGIASAKALESGDTQEFANLMIEQWMAKKARSSSTTNPKIEHWYWTGLKNGAMGGKLIGAGGGGFLMFYSEQHKKLRKAMAKEGLQEVRFRFDFEGTKVVV